MMSNATIAEEQALELQFVAAELDTAMHRAPLNKVQTTLVVRDIANFGAVEGLYTGNASCPVSVARMTTTMVDMTVDRDIATTGPVTTAMLGQNQTDLERLRFTTTAIERDLQAGGFIPTT